MQEKKRKIVRFSLFSLDKFFSLKVFLILLTFTGLAGILWYANIQITGLAVYDTFSFEKAVNLSFENSTEYRLRLEPGITSLSISGSAEGEGPARIYLEYNRTKKLVAEIMPLSPTITKQSPTLPEIIGNETENRKIEAKLGYKTQSPYDSDDDGIETEKGIVDIEVSGSFNWPVDESKLCSIWDVYSEESKESTLFCNGAELCCNFLNLSATELQWNALLYLYKGLYGAAENNTITAQIRYVDYNLSLETPFSEIYTSESQTAVARFVKKAVLWERQCAETCSLPRIGTDDIKLVVELEDTKLHITSLHYSAEKPRNITSIPPRLTNGIPPLMVYLDENLTINLLDYFSDEDSSVLNYTLLPIEDVGTEFNGSLLTLIPKNTTGTFFTFITANDSEFIAVSNLFNITVKEPVIINLTENLTQQPLVIVGQPVRWVKKITAAEATANLTVNITADASNITVKKLEQGIRLEIENVAVPYQGKTLRLEEYETAIKVDKIEGQIQSLNDEKRGVDDTEELKRINKKLIGLKEQKDVVTGAAVFESRTKGILTRFFEWLFINFNADITGAAVTELPNETAQQNVTNLIIEEPAMELEIEYYTEGPSAIEREVNADTKQVTIISATHYENILAFTSIPETPQENIKLFWINNDSKERIPLYDAKDTNNNSKIDEIYWIVPSLSNQTYEVVIRVKDAEHLAENRSVLDNIYYYVNALDRNYTVPIQPGQYVRATFEKPLENKRDITIWARSSAPASIDIYLNNSDDVVATIDNIQEPGYYKTVFTTLQGSYDVFDLKVKDAPIEFDYIVDPSVDDCSNLSSAGSYTLTRNVNSTATCMTINVSGVTLDCQGYSINYSNNDVGYGVYVNTANTANIKNCNIYKGLSGQSNAYGIYLIYSTGSLVLNNSINTSSTRDYGVYLQFSNFTNISSNKIMTSGTLAHGILTWKENHFNNITDNTINTSNTNGHGMLIDHGSKGDILSRNIINTSGDSAFGIYLYGTNTTNVTYNQIQTTGLDSYGIYTFYEVRKNNISQNNITGVQMVGVYLDIWSDNNTVTGNRITTTTLGTTVYLYNATFNNLSNNIIKVAGNNYAGIFLDWNSTNNIVSYNNITSDGSGTYGVYIRKNSENNSVENNNITTSGNDAYGMYILNASRTNITRNNVKTSGVTGHGIAVESTNYFNVSENIINASANNSRGISAVYASYGSIQYNVVNMSGNDSRAILITSDSSYHNISFNRINSSGYKTRGINYDAHNVTVFNNSIEINGNDTYGIRLTTSDYNNLSFNWVTIRDDGYSWGMMIEDSNFSLIHNNNISVIQEELTTFQAGSDGINLYNSHFSNVSLNEVILYGGPFIDGIVVGQGASYNKILNNTIYFNGFEGSGLLAQSSNNIFSNNSVNITGSASAGFGIQSNAETRNNFTANTIYSTGSFSHGVLIRGGSANSSYLNNTIYTEGTGSHAFLIMAASSYNQITNNTIRKSGGDGLVITNDTTDGLSLGNNFTNNILNNVAGYEFVVRMQDKANNTYLIDQPIKNYSINISTIHFRNTQLGDMYFFQNLNGSGFNLSSDIRFGNGSVFVNSTNNVGLNKSANITFYNFGQRTFVAPVITKDGINCTHTADPNCYNFTALNASTVIFNVSSFSNFSIAEGDPAAVNTIPTIAEFTMNSSGLTNSSSEDLTAWIRVTDVNGEQSFRIFYRWFKNNTEQAALANTANASYNVLTNISTLANGNTSDNDNWTVMAVAFDGYANSTPLNVSMFIVANPPPTISRLLINSTYNTNFSNENLTAWINATDTSGEQSFRIFYRWFNNGVEQTALAANINVTPNITSNFSMIISGNTTVGDNWTVMALAADGFSNSSFTNASIIIKSNTPVMNNLVINSSLATNTSTEDITAWLQPTDPDNESSFLAHYRWFNNSIEEPGLQGNLNISLNILTNITTIRESNLSKNQNWTVMLWLNDGYANTTFTNLSLITRNTIPAHSLIINSSLGTNTSNENLLGWVRITDVDNETTFITNFRWFKGQVEQSALEGNVNITLNTLSSITLLAGNLSAGDNWTLMVRVFDGDAYDAFTNASILLSSAGGAVCGNGAKEGTEECDDGNAVSGDGCSSTCVVDGGAAAAPAAAAAAAAAAVAPPVSAPVAVAAKTQALAEEEVAKVEDTMVENIEKVINKETLIPLEALVMDLAVPAPVEAGALTGEAAAYGLGKVSALSTTVGQAAEAVERKQLPFIDVPTPPKQLITTMAIIEDGEQYKAEVPQEVITESLVEEKPQVTNLENKNQENKALLRQMQLQLKETQQVYREALEQREDYYWLKANYEFSQPMRMNPDRLKDQVNSLQFQIKAIQSDITSLNQQLQEEKKALKQPKIVPAVMPVLAPALPSDIPSLEYLVKTSEQAIALAEQEIDKNQQEAEKAEQKEQQAKEALDSAERIFQKQIQMLENKIALEERNMRFEYEYYHEYAARMELNQLNQRITALRMQMAPYESAYYRAQQESKQLLSTIDTKKVMVETMRQYAQQQSQQLAVTRQIALAMPPAAIPGPQAMPQAVAPAIQPGVPPTVGEPAAVAMPESIPSETPVAEAVQAVEAVPPEQQPAFIMSMPPELQQDVIMAMPPEEQASIIATLPLPEALAPILEAMPDEQQAEILAQQPELTPEAITIVEALPPEQQAEVLQEHPITEAIQPIIEALPQELQFQILQEQEQLSPEAIAIVETLPEEQQAEVLQDQPVTEAIAPIIEAMPPEMQAEVLAEQPTLTPEAIAIVESLPEEQQVEVLQEHPVTADIVPIIQELPVEQQVEVLQEAELTALAVPIIEALPESMQAEILEEQPITDITAQLIEELPQETQVQIIQEQEAISVEAIPIIQEMPVEQQVEILQMYPISEAIAPIIQVMPPEAQVQVLEQQQEFSPEAIPIIQELSQEQQIQVLEEKEVTELTAPFIESFPQEVQVEILQGVETVTPEAIEIVAQLPPEQQAQILQEHPIDENTAPLVAELSQDAQIQIIEQQMQISQEAVQIITTLPVEAQAEILQEHTIDAVTAPIIQQLPQPEQIAIMGQQEIISVEAIPILEALPLEARVEIFSETPITDLTVEMVKELPQEDQIAIIQEQAEITAPAIDIIQALPQEIQIEIFQDNSINEVTAPLIQALPDEAKIGIIRQQEEITHAVVEVISTLPEEKIAEVIISQPELSEAVGSFLETLPTETQEEITAKRQEISETLAEIAQLPETEKAEAILQLPEQQQIIAYQNNPITQETAAAIETLPQEQQVEILQEQPATGITAPLIEALPAEERAAILQEQPQLTPEAVPILEALTPQQQEEVLVEHPVTETTAPLVLQLPLESQKNILASQPPTPEAITLIEQHPDKVEILSTVPLTPAAIEVVQQLPVEEKMQVLGQQPPSEALKPVIESLPQKEQAEIIQEHPLTAVSIELLSKLPERAQVQVLQQQQLIEEAFPLVAKLPAQKQVAILQQQPSPDVVASYIGQALEKEREGLVAKLKQEQQVAVLSTIELNPGLIKVAKGLPEGSRIEILQQQGARDEAIPLLKTLAQEQQRTVIKSLPVQRRQQLFKMLQLGPEAKVSNFGLVKEAVKENTLACVKVKKEDEANYVRIAPVTASLPTPKGYEQVMNPFKVACADKKAKISISLPERYSNIRLLSCEGEACAMSDLENVKELNCGAPLPEVRRISTMLEPSQFPLLIEPITKEVKDEHKTLLTGRTKVTFKGDPAGTATVKPAGSVPQPSNPSLKITGTPTFIDLRNMQKVSALDIALPYAEQPHIQPDAINIYYLQKDGWHILESSINETVKRATASIPDINEIQEPQNLTLAVIGALCTSCLPSTLEKMFVPENPTDKAIVLIHGFASSAKTYQQIVDDIRLTQQPYKVYVFDYAQNRSLDTIALELADLLEARSTEFNELSLVGHSLGGLLAQRMLFLAAEANKRDPDQYTFIPLVKQAFIIGSPNRGSPLAENFKSLLNILTNKASEFSLLKVDSVILSILRDGIITPRVKGVEYKVIAGTRDYELNLLLFDTSTSSFFDEPSDGVVAISSAQQVGPDYIPDRCKDYYEINVTHTDLLHKEESRKVIEGIISASQDSVLAAGKTRYYEMTLPQCDSGQTYTIVGKTTLKGKLEDRSGCSCGNGFCGIGETSTSCPSDCLSIATKDSFCSVKKPVAMLLLFIMFLMLMINGIIWLMKRHTSFFATIFSLVCSMLLVGLGIGNYFICDATYSYAPEKIQTLAWTLFFITCFFIGFAKFTYALNNAMIRRMLRMVNITASISLVSASILFLMQEVPPMMVVLLAALSLITMFYSLKPKSVSAMPFIRRAVTIKHWKIAFGLIASAMLAFAVYIISPLIYHKAPFLLKLFPSIPSLSTEDVVAYLGYLSLGVVVLAITIALSEIARRRIERYLLAHPEIKKHLEQPRIIPEEEAISRAIQKCEHPFKRKAHYLKYRSFIWYVKNSPYALIADALPRWTFVIKIRLKKMLGLYTSIDELEWQIKTRLGIWPPYRASMPGTSLSRYFFSVRIRIKKMFGLYKSIGQLEQEIKDRQKKQEEEDKR